MGTAKSKAERLNGIWSAVGTTAREADWDRLHDRDLAGCAQVHAQNGPGDPFVLARVDVMSNRLVVSADGIVLGWWVPEERELLADIVGRSPHPFLVAAELFYANGETRVRLYYPPR